VWQLGVAIAEAACGAWEFSIAADYSRRAASFESVVIQHELTIPAYHNE